MSDVLEGSFRGWENERCSYDYNNYEYTNYDGNDSCAKWYSIDGHYNLKIERTGEIYLKMRWYYYYHKFLATTTYEGNGYYTFKIDADDTENFMNFLIDIIYEKNVKTDNLKNYFEDIY